MQTSECKRHDTAVLYFSMVNMAHAHLQKLICGQIDMSNMYPMDIATSLANMNREENIEDENLLPSKKHGKSEITLVPIKREKKPCGHYESCEYIICDVAVQQYVDRDGSSPMLATNIEEDEINASVSKHCTNERCDALSIDHDRCRRAVIRLNRCNQSMACDICGIALKTQRSRIHHKNCTRKNEYRHNDTSSNEIQKERLREREIQIMEASKIKKNDYMDPVIGFSLAMETLRNNKELIIIQKSVPVQQQQQQPTIDLSSLSMPQSTLQRAAANNVLGKLLPSLPIVLPQQSIVLANTQCSNENSLTTPIHVALSNTLSVPLVTTTSIVPLPQSQYITFTTQTNTHPVPINDLLLPHTQIVTTPIQPKPLLTPIRVVPITNLITQPSVLHQTQGIPKFCIMPDNTMSSLNVTNPQPTQPPTSVSKVALPRQVKVQCSAPQKKRKSMTRKKRKLKKKDFKCTYCLKCFSTDWYFKMHVAMHTGEKRFSCKICTQSFSNKFDLKRHVSSSHEDESINRTTGERQTAEESFKCIDCNISFTTDEHLRHHRQKCHQNVETEKEVPSNFVDTKIDDLDIQPEIKAEENKLNGYVCTSNQDIISCIKTELCHEV